MFKKMHLNVKIKKLLTIYLLLFLSKCDANDILGCGGFVKSHVSLDFSKIEIGLYTKSGSLKEKTECAPTNGYYFLPLYEKGDYVLKVHPPAGWSFEPSEVELTIDGTTDLCSSGQDINFSFNGFGITGRVITAGQKQGPGGISVQLIDEKGEVRNTVTTVGGDFHFTPVIPGKYTVKASHPRWKLDPAQAVVQVKEGNTALPVGVLAVKGYDVKGSITSFGAPISGLYVLLYSKEENPKYRIEGCNTALLQGVPDSPICHTLTDTTGEFTFGLVPAGEYELRVLSTPPGQVAVTYNVKPEKVAFSILHDSLYIKNAFEVTGFTLVGSALAGVGGPGVRGARVELASTPRGRTDHAGRFTLADLAPGVYTLALRHDQCEFDESQVSVSSSGPSRSVTVVAARWRACGEVTPASPRRVSITRDDDAKVYAVTPGDDGKWCTFLPPGVYTAKVDVSDQEQRDGLQYYPPNRKIAIAKGPVDGVLFSQLKGKLTGRVICLSAADCAGLAVTLRPLSPDGGYVGQPLTTTAKDGQYSFSGVLPGSVEVSVPSERLCWRDARHNVVLTAAHVAVPDFTHQGYVLRFHATHDMQVEYKGATSSGVLSLPRGASQQCVEAAEKYELTPRGCHRFQPEVAHADTSADNPATVHFAAVSHAAVVRVTSPVAVPDLVLRVTVDGRGADDVGPLPARPAPAGGYVFEHTLYMADGEVASVWASSSSLLLEARGPQSVVGGAECQHSALTLRALPALTLTGRVRPPVDGVVVTLTSDELTLSQTTSEDGTYKFGPLDASKKYEITAEKESYVFGAVDENGDISAHKLAEITVQLVDDADDTPLQGALVSVSGGTYRRVQATAADGGARFAALSPAEYYVKTHMKEYRFAPPHHLLHVADGKHHHLKLRGTRVAWSCVGRLLSLGAAGVSGATLVAAPTPHSHQHCAHEEATTEHSGGFRIRGLLPDCVYTIELKESSDPELAGLKLAKKPATLEVKNNKDIENVRLIAIQPQQITDANVLVYTPNIDHYKTLRLTLALENTPHTPIYSTKLDPVGYNQNMNPGLMYVLPRLPADNKTYVLHLESTLSKSTHTYSEIVRYFNSDGNFKSFNIDFLPKVKSSEQELRQTSVLVVPVLLVLALAWHRRAALLAAAGALLAGAGGAGAGGGGQRGPARPDRPDLLDKASIDHIVSTVNAAGKRTAKKKIL